MNTRGFSLVVNMSEKHRKRKLILATPHFLLNVLEKTCIVYFVHLCQEIADARAIRNKILTNFELATQMKTTQEERERLLHFVIVGGGPTGVEFGGEFYDFLMQASCCIK